jgi:hypothetical protein
VADDVRALIPIGLADGKLARSGAPKGCISSPATSASQELTNYGQRNNNRTLLRSQMASDDMVTCSCAAEWLA